MLLIAIVGTSGLQPALDAIESGKDLAVASKEILVMAGEAVMSAAQKRGVKILPVDSEHNAIFQCLDGRPSEVRRIILTASGGPFRETSANRLADVTVEEALRHPTWNMGPKITIDSATLFNKGLEMIEAHWLFGVEMNRVEIVIHPQSIVHSIFFFQAEDGIRDVAVTGVQTCALPISAGRKRASSPTARPCTVARMISRPSTSSPGAIATRPLASAGPRFSPTSTATSARLCRPWGAATPRGSTA